MGKYVLKGKLIDGIANKAIDDGLVVVDGGRIAYSGEMRESAMPPDAEVCDFENKTILPGFIDCHTHVSGKSGDFGLENICDRVLSASASLSALLDAGFTLIRDMTEFSAPLCRAVARGDVRGPEIIPGSRVISPTAGHCDDYPGLDLDVAKRIVNSGLLADGKDECLRVVRQEFRNGARFIKICATGGVSSPTDGMDDVQYSDEEIRAMVDEAHRHGTYVAAHSCNAAGTYQALTCGVECIEHGDGIDAKCIAFMRENGIPLITTLYVTKLVATLDEYSDFMLEKGKATLQRQIDGILAAHSAGVTVAYGTDFENSKNTPYLKNGLEFRALVEAGLTPMEAIKTATVNAARAVRCIGRLGTLEAGKQADIVVVNGDPLENIDCLTDAKNITVVMKNGEFVKHG